MRYIYILLLLITFYIVVYLITEDRCNIESFTQIDNSNYICDDNKATNTYEGDHQDKTIDNSYCHFNNETVCNRPFADNYNSLELDINNGVCNDMEFSNYVDVYEYDKDENGNYILDNNDNKIKKRVKKSEVNGNPLKYNIDGKTVVMDEDNDIYLKYEDGTVVYKKKYNIDNSKCKNINNKICRFPMAKTNVNSLYGISSNENEFKSLVNDNNELMPNNYRVQGEIFNEKQKQIIRQDKKSIYKKLFFDSETIEGLGLNLWSINSYVNYRQLTTDKDSFVTENYNFINNDKKTITGDIYNSFIDNKNILINIKGYGFSTIPRNYYELVKFANNNGFHIALAVSENADKYACGIATTKAIACDIALARCKTFVSLEKLEYYFNGLESMLQIELRRRRNVNAERSWINNIKNLYINTVDNEQAELIDNYINNKDTLSLATMYYRLHTHNELYFRYNNSLLSDDENKLIEANLIQNSSVTELPSLVSVMKYIMNKAKTENETNKCGILLVNNDRYINYNNDATNIQNICNPLPDIPTLCNDNKCNEATVLGLNQDNKCFILHDFNLTFPDWDKFDNLPVKNENNDKWVDEKNNILQNDKINTAQNLLEKCKKIGNNCIMYKINGEIYSYNSLFN